MTEWQPIITAPRDKHILLFIPHSGWGVVRGSFRMNQLFGETWDFEDGHFIAIDGATHWMPLPEPPIEVAS